MTFISAPIPFHMSGNRQFLTSFQLFENAELREFVERFRKSFEYDPASFLYWYMPEEDA